MATVICILTGYLIGAFNISVLISRMKGFDIRKKGTGNAGAANAALVMGRATGVFIAFFDIAKAVFAMWLTSRIFPMFRFAGLLTGAMTVVGHVFPFYMGFHGGKGLACFGGLILAYDWRVFLILLAAELVLAVIFDYICVVPLTAAVIVPSIYAILEKDIIGTIILIIPCILIFSKHIENIRRIRNGTEAHFSFLWHSKEEIERLRDKYE